MTQRVSLVAVLLLLAVAGCTWSTVSDDDLTLLVSQDGELQAQGFTLEVSDLPAFAEEAGKRHVRIIPAGRPTSYRAAVQARDALKAAGVANVSIGDAEQ